jgi:hypothetical protein
MHQQLWGYKVEEKLYLGEREQKRLNTVLVGCLRLIAASSGMEAVSGRCCLA